jgi:hypothetical protein
MEKTDVSKILIKDANLKIINLNEETAKKLIEETKQRQAEVLKLKEINRDMLKMVVQL